MSQRGDWTTWILYMLRAVENTANITFHKINDIVASKEAVQHAVEQDTDIRKSALLVQMIFSQPFVKVNHFTILNVYAENTARAYLNKLTDMGILEKRTINGHHYYLNLELYRILGE